MIKQFANLPSLLFLLLNGVLFFSCTESVRKNLSPKPIAFGDINHVYVIADEEVWKGPAGDTLRYYYSSPFLVTPQPEPIFDIGHYTFRQFTEEKMRMNLRSLVFLADLSDEDSPTTKYVKADIALSAPSETKSKVGKDKWAKDQTLVYLYGDSPEDLVATIRSTWGAVRKKFNDADAHIVTKTAFVSGKDITIMNQIEEQFGIKIEIPEDYYQALNQDKTIWLRKETDVVSSNILISKVKYTDKQQLSDEGIKAALDSIGKKYISSRQEGSYFKINDVDLPTFVKKVSVSNNYAKELKGIWELENDYMGGSFLAYAILDERTQNLFYINGFVFAPGKPKMPQMQYLGAIFKTINIP